MNMHSRAADRSAGRPGGRPALSHRCGDIRRRPEARRDAARGGLAQQRRAWTYQRRRCVGRAGAQGRASGNHRGRDRDDSVDPIAACEPSGIRALPATGHRQGQGALRRRTDRGGCGGDPGAGRRRPRGDRCRYRTAAAVPDRHAAASDKSLLFETSGSNRAVRYSVTSGDADAAFAKAEYTRRESFRCHRLTAVPLETRGLIAEWDAAKQKLVIFGATKVLFFNRRVLAPMLGLSEQAIDMIELDVGGGFGVRGEFYPEDFLIPFAARHVGRPVKWIEDRREHLMATNHSREVDCDLEIACTREGTHPRLARPHLRRHGRLYPHQRRCRAGQGRAIPSRSLPHPRRCHHRRSADDEQDSRRHPSGTRAVRSELLSRAPARHRGAATLASIRWTSAAGT